MRSRILVVLTLTAENSCSATGVVRVKDGQSGRGERASPFVTHLSRPRFLMVNRTPRESFPVAAARSA